MDIIDIAFAFVLFAFGVVVLGAGFVLLKIWWRIIKEDSLEEK